MQHPETEAPAPEDPDRLQLEIRRLQRIAVLLDQAVTLPGTRIRIGLDAIIGLIPVAGDLLSAAISTWLIARAVRMGIPRPIIMRMLANMGIDAALGAIPVLGDLFDIGWRANTRNLELLLDYLQQQLRRLQEPEPETPPGQRWLRPALLLLALLLTLLASAAILWLLQVQGVVQG